MDLQEKEELTPQKECNIPMYCDESINSCPNCQALLNEIIELRMELGRRQEQERQVMKHFTIAPTLYTFYKDHTSKCTLVRFVWMILLLFIYRTASISSQTIIQKSGKVDYSYQEEIIQKCMNPLPNPYFVTMDFITHFLNQCDEMCMRLKRVYIICR